MLCNACPRILGAIDPLKDEYLDQDLGEHHASFAYIEKAVEAGHLMCRRLLGIMNTRFPLHVDAYHMVQDFSLSFGKSFKTLELPRTT